MRRLDPPRHRALIVPIIHVAVSRELRRGGSGRVIPAPECRAYSPRIPLELTGPKLELGDWGQQETTDTVGCISSFHGCSAGPGDNPAQPRHQSRMPPMVWWTRDPKRGPSPVSSAGAAGAASETTHVARLCRPASCSRRKTPGASAAGQPVLSPVSTVERRPAACPQGTPGPHAMRGHPRHLPINRPPCEWSAVARLT